MHRKIRKLNQRQICISGFLSAERSPLVWLSPSHFLGSISMFKTFMHGHLCVVTFPHLETRAANFPLSQFSELFIGSVSLSPILGSISTFKTFMCGDFSALKKPEM